MSDSGDAGAHPLGFIANMFDQSARQHDRAHAQMEDRYLSSMRWLDSLDVEGLMALRYVLICDSEEAYGNNKFYDGMAIQLLRNKGVDPRNGKDLAAQLLPDDH